MTEFFSYSSIQFAERFSSRSTHQISRGRARIQECWRSKMCARLGWSKPLFIFRTAPSPILFSHLTGLQESNRYHQEKRDDRRCHSTPGESFQSVRKEC